MTDKERIKLFNSLKSTYKDRKIIDNIEKKIEQDPDNRKLVFLHSYLRLKEWSYINKCIEEREKQWIN